MRTVARAAGLGNEAGASVEPPEECGPPETFEQVFRRILPHAVHVAKRILGNETQAEDAAAEALARAHVSWGKIGRTEYRDAWILRVTANVAVDMCRRRRRIFSVGLQVTTSPIADESEAEASRLALAAALAALPRRQREVVVLRYLEGLPEEAVARALGVSVGTVKKTSFRARETLRWRLGADLAT